MVRQGPRGPCHATAARQAPREKAEIMFTFTIEQTVTRTWPDFQITEARLLPLVKEHMGMEPGEGESTEDFMGRVDVTGSRGESLILAILSLAADSLDEPAWVTDSGGTEVCNSLTMTDWYDES